MDAHKTNLAPSKAAMLVTKPALAAFLMGCLIAATAQAKDCVPSCRDGYVCHQGECIEACNPPCADGEVCVGEGQCVAAASSAPASSSAVQHVAYEAGDAGEKPSTAVSATFVGLGGFLMIAGGVVFGTTEWDCGYYYYSCYWDTGQYVGVGLMSLGLISLATATPFLVRQVKAKRRWERNQMGALGRDLSVAPIVAPTPRNQTYGVTLRGSF